MVRVLHRRPSGQVFAEALSYDHVALLSYNDTRRQLDRPCSSHAQSICILADNLR